MLKVIKKRRSFREYLDKEVEEEKIIEILKAAMFSPSSKHRRPWEFIVVKNSKTRQLLAKATAYSAFIVETPFVIAICADETKDPRWVEDLSVAAAHIYLEVTNQGLGTCWIQIRNAKGTDGGDAEEYVRKVLEIPKNKRVLCLMPIGCPAYELPEHQDEEYEKKKIHQEKW